MTSFRDTKRSSTALGVRAVPRPPGDGRSSPGALYVARPADAPPPGGRERAIHEERYQVVRDVEAGLARAEAGRRSAELVEAGLRRSRSMSARTKNPTQFDRRPRRSSTVLFDAISTDGPRWMLTCLPGQDVKDGHATEFTHETLSQFIENFVERGDDIPLDANHLSQMVAQTGQPAPALGFCSALALVLGGRVVRAGKARGSCATFAEPGLDLSTDGLYALRSEITPYGKDLLPNFKFVSPTFTAYGERRDGSECGYSLISIAMTNTPHQPGTRA